MRVIHRLYLTAAPAILGVLLIAGLFYWGQYAHRVPGIVLVVGVVAVVGSLVLAWTNARIIARRIERLATSLPAPDVAGAPDELDRIASGVDRLSSDVQSAEAGRADHERAIETRIHDYASLLATIANDNAKRLEEVRLPLHILLENRFGDLNENQEEMLGAARTAAEAADADLVSLRQIAELDLGDHPLRRDRIKPSELVEALRPMLVAAAESVGATIEVSVAPLLPAIVGDRARLQDALATTLGDAIRSAAPGAHAQLTVEQHGDDIRVELAGRFGDASSVRLAAAAHVINAHGGTIGRKAHGLTLHLPLESKGRLNSG